jgi:transposase
MLMSNNICERALKKAILHRKNSYFFKTEKGAHVADVFMTIIHTAELNKVNAFDYLVALHQHHDEVVANPADWMPWNYKMACGPPQSQPS